MELIISISNIHYAFNIIVMLKLESHVFVTYYKLLCGIWISMKWVPTYNTR